MICDNCKENNECTFKYMIRTLGDSANCNHFKLNNSLPREHRKITMTEEELRNKAENLAIKEARNYKTVYSEDFKLKEVLNDPLRFDQDFPERLYLLMKEKHYRDGFSDGYITGATDICKKILEEVRTHEGIEQMTKFYIGEIIKSLGVDIK